jgi:hypothetical protein
MPLHKGGSRKVIGENISEMEDSGYKPSQAIAASLNEARKSGAHIPHKSHNMHRKSYGKVDQRHAGNGRG